MFQRLQQRMNRKKVITEAEPELSSFYPDTEDGWSTWLAFSSAECFLEIFKLCFSPLAVETIVITPFLPVVAFGRPLPKLSQE